MNNTGTLALGIVLLQATGNIERELKSNSRLPLSDVFTIGWPSVPETLKLRLAFQWHGDSYVFEGTLSKTTFVMLRNNPSKAMMPFELCLEEEGKERAVELTKSSVAETVHPEKPAGESVNSA